MADSFINYLYIEANEGDSSGGHVAIRFGDETFHFQHESPGILRLQRQDSAAFHHVYAMLGNRSIRESRIAVSDDTYAQLRHAFVRLLMVQEAQLEIRDALHRDVALFDLLLRQKRAHGSKYEILLPLSGVGYFLPDIPSLESRSGAVVKGDGAGFSPALASLRDRIRDTYGERFISERAARARAGLRTMQPHAARRPLPQIARDAFPAFAATASTRYQDVLHAIVALELLQAAPQLRPATYWMPGTEEFRLKPEEALALKKYAGELESDLVRLADSERGDWGFPFVLGMARMAAIEASLASGRLVLLDIFPPDTPLPPRHDSALRPYLPMMESEMREAFLRKRRSFFSADGFREAEYAAMELSGNLLLDLDRAMATGSALRAIPKTSFPSREATIRMPAPAERGEANLVRELAAAQDAELDFAAALGALYAYDLVRRNCVTEIFSVINGAITSAGHQSPGKFPATAPDTSVRSESKKRLGGFVDASQGLAFIPFVSARAVERSYAVVESRDSPSYRTARLEEMKAREGPLKVFLRESNTITSSVYRPGPGDSAFLFFTNDTLLFRPLFGAFNLLAGLGEGLLGLVTMPVEGAERLLSGTRGMLFSLPELFFVNIRKGSMAYVEKPGGKNRYGEANADGRFSPLPFQTGVHYLLR